MRCWHIQLEWLSIVNAEGAGRPATGKPLTSCVIFPRPEDSAEHTHRMPCRSASLENVTKCHILGDTLLTNPWKTSECGMFPAKLSRVRGTG